MRNIAIVAAMLLSITSYAANLDSTAVASKKAKADIVKSGYSFGPLPALAYDADKGFQYGALLNIYNYGDGSYYPNCASKWYLEASFFTKGSQLYQLQYDNKSLIPGVRWSTTMSATIDKAMDFYGFNGYQSYYDSDRIALGSANTDNPLNYIYTPYYRISRSLVLAKTDFIGNITDNLQWEAGFHFAYYGISPIDRVSINKGKADYNIFPDSQPTLFENFVNWGIIDSDMSPKLVSSIRLGLCYDTRDKEGAPSRGTWAEAHITAAPSFLGTTDPFARYTVTLRKYFPLIDNDVLTFAGRFNYEGTIGNAPYYVLPFFTTMGENSDKDGMGGSKTVRGMVRDRVVGLDMATWTAELRWRFVKFQMLNQNIAFGLNVFTDGVYVTRGVDMSFRGEEQYRAEYEEYMAKGYGKDTAHLTFGGGLRFIMNENFIISVEYGLPFSKFYNNSLRGQDGTGSLYIGLGYLF